MGKYKLMSNKDIPMPAKKYPYYCDIQLRMMTNNEILSRLDKTSINEEMVELERELKRRQCLGGN